MNWMNVSGLVIVVIMLLPNLIFFAVNKNHENKCKNKTMNALEQSGRYASMFLMVFPVGIDELGFGSDDDFMLWLMMTSALLLLYLMLWFLYFKKIRPLLSILLAIIPGILFVSNGVFLRHGLLVFAGFIFLISHIYVTYKNIKD